MPRGRPKGSKGKARLEIDSGPRFYKAERTGYSENGFYGPGGSDMGLREAFKRVLSIASSVEAKDRDKEALEIIKALARGSYGVKDA